MLPMNGNAGRRAAPRSTQDGSVGPVVVLIVVAVLVWWQWDRISALFGSRSSVGGGTVAVEVLEYRCQPQSGAGVRIDGQVRNASDTPISFRAITAIYDSSDKISDYRETNVRPSPLPPGQDGYFQMEGPPLPDGGYCKLGSIVDAETDRPVRLTRGRR